MTQNCTLDILNYKMTIAKLPIRERNTKREGE